MNNFSNFKNSECLFICSLILRIPGKGLSSISDNVRNLCYFYSTVQRHFYENLDYIRPLHYTKNNYLFCSHFALKNLPTHGSVITCGGLVPTQNLQPWEPKDIATLLDETKQFIFKYDCDCVPLFKNQIGTQDAGDNLASLWGIQLLPTSPATFSGQSLPTNPLIDLSATTKPHSTSPSILEALSRDQVPWMFGIGKTSQETPKTKTFS